MVDQNFVLIQRNYNNEVNTFVEKDLFTAIAMQKDLLFISCFAIQM